MKVYVTAIILLASLFSTCSVFSQQQDKELIRLHPNLVDAINLALEDCKTLPIQSRSFTRYVWITGGDMDSLRALSLVLNMNSRGTTLIRPIPLSKNSLLLARVDLRAYSPKEKDLLEWTNTWEDLQFDPALNRLLTKGSLRFLVERLPDLKIKGWLSELKDVEIEVEPYVFKGRTYTWKWVKKRIVKEGEFTLKGLKDIELKT